jgi:hypothetical protein
LRFEVRGSLLQDFLLFPQTSNFKPQASNQNDFVPSKQKMARSHHRKKHKEQLRHFKHKEQTTYTTPKSKAANVFAVAGAIAGLAVSYFSTQGSTVWVFAGLIGGGLAGYLVGRKVDQSG